MLAARDVVAAALVFSANASAYAQTLSLAGPSLAPDRKSVTVRIANTPRPDPSTFADKGMWVVIVRTPTTPAGTQVLLQTIVPTQFYSDTGLIRLSFQDAVDDNASDADVVWLGGKPVRVTWSRKKPNGGYGFFPVDKREKSDVYLFGSWVTGIDIAPSYNLDLTAGTPPVEFTFRGSLYRASLGLELKSADHRKIDPDSYKLAAKVMRAFPIDLDSAGPYLDLQWEFARLEFSRKDEFSNFVSAPTATFSHQVYTKLNAAKQVKAAIDAELFGGIETGFNMQSKVVPEGYGSIFRLVPGGAVYAVFPGAFGFEEIRVTSTYRARVLLTKEAFTDVRDDDHPFPSTAKGTRHQWKDQLDFKLTPLVGLSIAHEFGSTPPAFKILNHRFTVGATAMWAWKK